MSQQTKKVALVTGGSSGIGEATAIEFAKLNYQVAITGLEQPDLDRVLQLLVENSPSKLPEDFLTFKLNFSDPAQVEGLIESTVAKFGRLDVLVNNAGISDRYIRIVDQDFYENYKTVMQVNLHAPVRLSQLATPHLLKTKGVIISLSSILSKIGKSSISYSVTKAGISMMTDCLANAFDGTGVRALAIAPGPIETGIRMRTPDGKELGMGAIAHLTSVGRVGQPIDMANLIVFLASDKASFINGCTVSADGGFIAKFGGVFNSFCKPINE